MKAMEKRCAEPRRTDYEREEGGRVGVLTSSGVIDWPPSWMEEMGAGALGLSVSQ